jgi:hypothetical protein
MVAKNKNPRGRPIIDTADVTVRMLKAELAIVDEWMKRNMPEGTRAEAIRHLVSVALRYSSPSRRPSRKAADKAATMAGREVDSLGDQFVTRAQRAKRKRRLIEGPKEFRGMRKDRS